VYSNSQCVTCARWTITSWYCGDCCEITCESCGKFDEKDKVLLCPECFLKPGEDICSEKK